tara:strand:- start:249 stop:881 length:633 start_codon:yes stop_codon:yes gene_type:complete
LEIQEIYIPDISIPVIHDPQITIQPSFPQVPTFGCTSTHRDTKNTGNFNLIFDDPSGTSTSCPYPTFVPLNYQPDQLIIVEESLPSIDLPPLPKSQSTEVPPIKKKKDEDILPPCPGKNDRRVGEYTSEARTERIKSYKRGSDGVECIPEYEQVTFVDSVLPSPSAALNVATISLIAATSPILLNVIKSVSKTIFQKISKKLTKKKDKVE